MKYGAILVWLDADKIIGRKAFFASALDEEKVQKP
jgi:hypothetical protein